MPLHLQEFERAQFQGYIENVPPAREYPLASLLPDQNISDINFSYYVINGQYAPAASITGFNAVAPLRDKKQLERAFGSVAKVQHGQRLDEEQLLRFNRPRDSQEKQQAVDYVYDTTDDLLTGVRDIGEYLRAQTLYSGEIAYEDEENDININVDFGVPSDNRLSAEGDWSDHANSRPLTDIYNAIEQFKKENQRRRPMLMHMTSATEANLLQSEQIRFQIYGESTGQRLLTPQDVRNVFSALNFPPYAINDDIVQIQGEGEVQLLEDNKVVFFGANLGNTYHGPTVENNYNSGVYVIPEIRETNPPSQSIYVGETVFPALARPQAVVYLSV